MVSVIHRDERRIAISSLDSDTTIEHCEQEADSFELAAEGCE